MGMENNFNSAPKKEVSTRLWMANEVMMKMAVGKIKVSGLDNLKSIPPDTKTIILTTHLTDLDVPIAIHATADKMNITTMNMSVHHSPFGKQGEFSTYAGMQIAGKDNFLPIDYKKGDDGKKISKPFNPDNFEPAVKAMSEGRTILMAAHNPSEKPIQNLDEVKGGYGGVYLAALTGAYIFPVTVTLDRASGMHGDTIKTMKEKPNSEVIIGEPFKIEKIDGIENLSKLTKKREDGIILNEEEISEFLRITKALREQSQIVIEKMSNQMKNIPNEKE